MPRRKRKLLANGRNAFDRFVGLPSAMLNSDAYRALDLASRAALVEFTALFNGINNGELFMSVRELGRRMGASPNTALKAIRQLTRLGLIAEVSKGEFVRKDRHASTWRLAFKAVPGEGADAWRPASHDYLKQGNRFTASELQKVASFYKPKEPKIKNQYQSVRQPVAKVETRTGSMESSVSYVDTVSPVQQGRCGSVH